MAVPPAPVEPQWHHPASLADTISMDGNDSCSGSVAAGENGDAIIAVEYGSRVFASERRNGVWSHPVRYVTLPHNPAGGSVFTPRMAVRPDGTTIMTWVQRDGTIDRVYKSVYANGAWTDPTSHADHISPNAGSALQPWVAFDPAGDAVEVWEQYTANGGSIFKSEVHNGVWSNPSGPNDAISPLQTHAQDVHLAAGPNGHVIVVWAQADLQNYRIFKSERRNGVWTHPTGLSDNISPPGTDAYRPKVAFDDHGDAVIAWVQSDGAFVQVFTSELRNGAWRHPTSLADNISPDGASAHAVAVAMAGDQAVVVWSQDVNATDSSLFVSEYRGGSWMHPAGLADHFAVGQLVREFVLAMGSSGHVVVPYTAADSSMNWATYLSERRDLVWTHATSLADHISPGATPTAEPAIAIDGDNAVIVIWRQSDGNFEKTYLSEFR